MSKYLPSDFDPTAPVGLIAGRGVYPRLIAEKALAAGIELHLIAFDGEAAQETIDLFPEDKRAVINVGKVGAWLKALRKFDCRYTIAAGQVKPGKLFRDLKPDLKAAALLMKLKRKNAHTIFGAIAEELAANGQTALDARSFLDDQMADLGHMTKAYEKIEDTYIQHGIEIAQEMARLDVGQGVVVRKGTVLAVEAFEGTDPMLKRAGGFKTDQLIFVKTVKRQQDYRFDVPVFGLRTLEIMAEHNIGTAVLKAGDVIMVEKEKILAAAARHKIQLIGF
ncbi:UDP-2,3-diacylglucosamine diphosphatase LpxI [Pelagicoccus sp. NFK12]|uniref:UDP-2,3-diacylglucosamine diphosphatase LpxI n=1 Tax=Pelagicoccus enzymogenes TaxID=2773457 RepID=A0A927F807_9BACT|nr:UDP-2,3-diacylglucosamine diphosphatase LpxI [Pelagicoccus enzymogenes]MBD5779635.1 UDP-2,3-diacylglucosamine diphosphatase LpxI [Pelagicoccus enzymogenes]